MSVATRCVNGVCVAVLPRPDNDFRPLALRHRPLAVVSALLLAVKAIALMAVAITPATAELSTITTARIVELTNAERTKRGLPALTVNSKLSQAAHDKGLHMLEEDYFAHISPSGVTPWFWMQKYGYSYQVAGENLAIDFVEAEAVVAAWLASPSHRDNMLHSSYTETGVAVVTGEFQGGTSTIVVHMFGLPAAGAATVTKPTPTPSPTPSPTPQVQAETTTLPSTPVPTPPPDTVPPRVPRIALVGATTTVQATVAVRITGDAGSTVHLVANDTALSQVALQSEEQVATVSLDKLPDGEVALRGWATDAAGNTSATSEPLLLAKDTTGPVIDRSALAFLLLPWTDRAQVLVHDRAPEVSALVVIRNGEQQAAPASGTTVLPLQEEPVAVARQDSLGNTGEPVTLSLLPDFAVEKTVDYVAPPARLSRAARWIAATAGALILVLLSLAIFIRIHIQRPALIAHASLVLLIALALSFI